MCVLAGLRGYAPRGGQPSSGIQVILSNVYSESWISSEAVGPCAKEGSRKVNLHMPRKETVGERGILLQRQFLVLYIQLALGASSHST